MPLIIVCGRPCVGKTTFCHALADYFRTSLSTTTGKVPAIHIINEESIGTDKSYGYKSM